MGTVPPPNGTLRLAKTARFETRPENDARSIALPPASAMTKRPRSKRTSTGLESISGLPTVASGLTSRSNAQMSAIERTCPRCLIHSRRPNRFATGFCAARVERSIRVPPWSSGAVRGSVGPPLVTKTRSAPRTVMPCGPIGLGVEAGSVLAKEARPWAMRNWCPRRSTSVTAPELPMHAGPSAATKHGPEPPLPASATKRSPRDPNARWRGASRFLATTSTLAGAARADGANAAATVRRTGRASFERRMAGMLSRGERYGGLRCRDAEREALDEIQVDLLGVVAVVADREILPAVEQEVAAA